MVGDAFWESAAFVHLLLVLICRDISSELHDRIRLELHVSTRTCSPTPYPESTLRTPKAIISCVLRVPPSVLDPGDTRRWLLYAYE